MLFYPNAILIFKNPIQVSLNLKMLQVMESSVNGGLSQLQSCCDSSEEELSVLPRHTKVVVTGNNRTKSVLVGLRGVVKKAVGLGGWHWLVIFYVSFQILLKAKYGYVYNTGLNFKLLRV